MLVHNFPLAFSMINPTDSLSSSHLPQHLTTLGRRYENVRNTHAVIDKIATIK